MNHNQQKKIAAINDLSGFGRCSLAVELPVISAMGVQCCPLPTSILSNHTGFESYFFDDYTDKMQPYADQWAKLGLHFDGICTGFLGSMAQIAIVTRFLGQFKQPNTVVVVDPVMGDYGRLYATYSMETCRAMRALLPYADILTPNLTEACLLCDEPYHERWTLRALQALSDRLLSTGPEKVVITGIPQGQFIANFCCVRGEPGKIIRTARVGQPRSGTGDLFAAIVSADAVNGADFLESVKKASHFIQKCLIHSAACGIPLTDGVCFESFLHGLK